MAPEDQGRFQLLIFYHSRPMSTDPLPSRKAQSRKLQLEFLARLESRLVAGAQEYGDASFDRPDTVDELLDEILDIAGWAFIVWVQLRRRLEGLELVAQDLEDPELVAQDLEALEDPASGPADSSPSGRPPESSEALTEQSEGSK